ncbi:hypothetical protein J5N97_018980 [Dioscorea zingiberensis]|uniref:RING-type domain-containing protein n=1 Tax=Dioscorea zingiberensis TaxID=325984 RepID=A0A9D5CD97_9LILI|nr:hypothetical protein J5N97_018980 [Dioscorea zingiberensis]
MENSRNPNPTGPITGGAGFLSAPEAPQQSSSVPFSSLSQVDRDYALACIIQEQERVFWRLRNGDEGSDFEDDDEFDDDDQEGSDYEEDVAAEGADVDPAQLTGDGGCAWELCESIMRHLTSRLSPQTTLDDGGVADQEYGHNENLQDDWQDGDPNELSYEELIALGDIVGTVNKGLSDDKIASLPSICYKSHDTKDGSSDLCVICQVNFEDGGSYVLLPCKHLYHRECISTWLQTNKGCPICNTEIS